MSEKNPRLAQLAAKTKLLELHPLSFSAASLTGQAIDAEAEVNLDLHVDVKHFIIPGGFSFLAIMRAQLKKEEKGPVLVDFRYNVIAKYHVPEGIELDADTRHDYAEHAGLLHVWPYFRSFVQESCGKLGQPMVLLPILHPGALKLKRMPDEKIVDLPKIPEL